MTQEPEDLCRKGRIYWRARAEKAEAERDEALKHLRNWMKWCNQLRPGDEHPYDHWKAASDFLALILKEPSP